jgi:hypothetical protein
VSGESGSQRPQNLVFVRCCRPQHKRSFSAGRLPDICCGRTLGTLSDSLLGDHLYTTFAPYRHMFSSHGFQGAPNSKPPDPAPILRADEDAELRPVTPRGATAAILASAYRPSAPAESAQHPPVPLGSGRRASPRTCCARRAFRIRDEFRWDGRPTEMEQWRISSADVDLVQSRAPSRSPTRVMAVGRRACVINSRGGYRTAIHVDLPAGPAARNRGQLYARCPGRRPTSRRLTIWPHAVAASADPYGEPPRAGPKEGTA